MRRHGRLWAPVLRRLRCAAAACIPRRRARGGDEGLAVATSGCDGCRVLAAGPPPDVRPSPEAYRLAGALESRQRDPLPRRLVSGTWPLAAERRRLPDSERRRAGRGESRIAGGRR
eukprot:272911-Hanusia_phi.AAC.1